MLLRGEKKVKISVESFKVVLLKCNPKYCINITVLEDAQF